MANLWIGGVAPGGSWIGGVVGATSTNNLPATPTISSGTITATGVTLTGSAFSDADVGDTHAASQWQVTLTGDTGFASPTISTGDDSTNKTTYIASGLTAGTAYRARVRYKDSAGGYSNYSASTTFTTNSLPATPTISAGTPTSTSCTLTSSAFSDADVSDTHSASQWQVTTTADTGFASPVIFTGDDTSNKTSYTATGLTAGTAYRARVRHKDSNGNYSTYSTSTTFTTASAVVFAGTVSFVSSGPAGIVVTATNATGGTTPYTYQWQRNINGGGYSNLSNGSGVSGATTLTLTDGSATAGNLYGYKILYTDSSV